MSCLQNEKSTTDFSGQSLVSFASLTIESGQCVLFATRSFFLFWYVDRSFEEDLSIDVMGLSRFLCLCLFVGIELPQVYAEEPDQQVLLVKEMFESCWRAFVAWTVSFNALTPLLIEDGSLADDLPKMPPRIISSWKDDWSMRKIKDIRNYYNAF